ncbi:MAG: hypothetical protein ACLUFL_03440 [Flavonifractor plautii]
MRTEASAKFEKAWTLNTLPAVQRACELVELLGAGEVGRRHRHPQPRTPAPQCMERSG